MSLTLPGNRAVNIPTRALLLCCMLALAACGQRGPLYLPDDQAKPADGQQEQQDNTDNTDQEEDEETT